MKHVLFFGLLLATVSANAKTTCSSEKVDDLKLRTLARKEIKLKNVQVDDDLLLGKLQVKVVDFYVTGGPEQGIVVAFTSGKKLKIWCTDEETPSDD